MPRIHLPSDFAPWKIAAVTHELANHPLLQLDALRELGQRQQARKLVRTHAATATAGTSFADAPHLHPTCIPPARPRPRPCRTWPTPARGCRS